MSQQSSDQEKLYEELERMMDNTADCDFLEIPRPIRAGNQYISPTETTTPDPLNMAFISETNVNQQEQHSPITLPPQQSQTTITASATIHDLINTIIIEENPPEAIDLRLYTTPEKISTVTTPQTPTKKLTEAIPRTSNMILTCTMPPITPAKISTSTIPKTPIMTSTGTIRRTSTMRSTGTMPTTSAMKSTGTMPMTPPGMKTIGTMPMTPPGMKTIGTMPMTPTMKTMGTIPRTPITMVSTGTMPRTASSSSSSSGNEKIDLCSPDTPTNTGSPK